MTRSLFGGRLASAGVTSMVAVVTVATTAAAVDFDGSYYARNVSLGANMDVFWTIDADLEAIRVAVHAKAASGWAGFGVSEMGGMEGADIVFYEASTGKLTDAHAIDAGPPATDECTQDWTLVSAEVDADSLVFEAERDLNTGDAQDHVFVDDSADGARATRILTAWGDQDTVSYHNADFAKGQVILYGGVENSIFDPIIEIASDPGVSSFDITARNFTIPPSGTWHIGACTPASDLPGLDEYHAIGFEAVVNSAAAEYVDHIVLRAFTVDNCGWACVEDDPTTSTSTVCDKVNFADIFAWTPGSPGMALPDDVGFLLGNAPGRFRSLYLQIHYDNPDGIEGLIDDSGVRVHYTEDLRPNNMGVVVLGDPNLELLGQPVPEGKSSYSFQCPSSCFEEHFEDDTVTVFSHGLHMHENGRRLETRQYRGNSDGEEVMVYSAEVEYFSFLQGVVHAVTSTDSVTIQKGDRFETDCYYDTDLSSVDPGSVVFGPRAENDMCVDIILYYPDQNIPLVACGLNMCGGDMDEAKELAADSDFERTFGIVETCPIAAESSGDEAPLSPISASFEVSPKDESTSSSSNVVPRLVPLTYAVTGAVALAWVPLFVKCIRRRMQHVQ